MGAKAEERWGNYHGEGNTQSPRRGRGCVGSLLVKSKELWSETDLGLRPGSTTNQPDDHEWVSSSLSLGIPTGKVGIITATTL